MTDPQSQQAPLQRVWLQRDWVKLAIMATLALTLIRPNPATLEPPTSNPVQEIPTLAPTPLAPTADVIIVPPSRATVTAPQIELTAGSVPAGPYTLTGTGTPGSVVEVLLNGLSLGLATVDADGRWSLPTELPAGPAELVALALEPGGRALAAAAPLPLQVIATEPTVAPVLPTPVVLATLDLPAEPLRSGPISLSGTGEPGMIVAILLDGVPAGITVVDPAGRWQFATGLLAGTNQLVVQALDPDGTVLASTAPLQLEVSAADDTATADLPTFSIMTPAEGATIRPGSLALRGTGQPGATLEVLNSDLVLATVTVPEDGIWATTVALPADGTASLGLREVGAPDLLGRPVRIVIGSGATENCATLTVGCPAWVTRSGGLVLRLRSAPEIVATNILARLPIGTQMQILAGPTAAGGQTWWQVRTVGGVEGWVAADNLVVQPD